MNAPDELRDGSRAAGWLNKLLSFVKMTRLVEGVGYRLIQTTRGTALEIQPGKGSSTPATVSRYRVESVQNDHLVCKEIEGESVATETTLIAKPFNLRRTGWHGVTVNYALDSYPGSQGSAAILYEFQTATYRIAKVQTEAGSTDEHQVITPHYVPGVSIVLASEISNDTGIADVTFQDLNDNGRAWARA